MILSSCEKKFRKAQFWLTKECSYITIPDSIKKINHKAFSLAEQFDLRMQTDKQHQNCVGTILYIRDLCMILLRIFNPIRYCTIADPT